MEEEKGKEQENTGVEVEIPKTKKAGGAKPYTLFSMKIRFRGKSWELDRRFSDFVALREKVSPFLKFDCIGLRRVFHRHIKCDAITCEFSCFPLACS